MFVRLAAATLMGALIIPAQAADQVEKAPPTGAYKKVSELVKLPDFDAECRASGPGSRAASLQVCLLPLHQLLSTSIHRGWPVGDESWLMRAGFSADRFCDDDNPVCAGRDIRPVRYADSRHAELVETLVHMTLVIQV